MGGLVAHAPPDRHCALLGARLDLGLGRGPCELAHLWQDISGEGISPTALPSPGRGAVPQLGGLILGLRGPAEARGPHLLFRRQRCPAAPRLVGSPGCAPPQSRWAGGGGAPRDQGPRLPALHLAPHPAAMVGLRKTPRFPWSGADGRCVSQAPEERVAWLRPQWAPADRQLLRDVADGGCGSHGPGVLAAGRPAAGAESRELPQRLHCALHREQLHDLLLQVGVCRLRRTGGHGAGGEARRVEKPLCRSFCPPPRVGTRPDTFLYGSRLMYPSRNKRKPKSVFFKKFKTKPGARTLSRPSPPHTGPCPLPSWPQSDQGVDPGHSKGTHYPGGWGVPLRPSVAPTGADSASCGPPFLWTWPRGCTSGNEPSFPSCELLGRLRPGAQGGATSPRPPPGQGSSPNQCVLPPQTTGPPRLWPLSQYHHGLAAPSAALHMGPTFSSLSHTGFPRDP